MKPQDIERAARHLVAPEPPPGLEARILARLDQVHPVPAMTRWVWWTSRVALPGGLAAVLAVAGIWALGLVTSEEPGIVAPPPTQTAAAIKPAALPRPGHDRSAAALVAALDSTRVIEAPIEREEEPELSPEETTWSEEAAWMARRIPALTTVEALSVEYLPFDFADSGEFTQPEPLSITPLIMTAMPLEPLGPDRRDQR